MPPAPLIKVIRSAADMEFGGRTDGELVQVHCGGCLKRTFDLTTLWTLDRGYDGTPYWRKTGAVRVSRMCPKCRHVEHVEVTLKPGLPLEGGFHGPWHCWVGCTSLAFIDANGGRVKATCWSCRKNVTTTALAAFSGRLGSVEEERERRHLIHSNSRRY